jgi:hypothetical protein
LLHGLAAREFYKLAGVGFDAAYNFVFGDLFALKIGVLGVAIGATELAAGEPDENAGTPRLGAFALDAEEDFVELQHAPSIHDRSREILDENAENR